MNLSNTIKILPNIILSDDYNYNNICLDEFENIIIINNEINEINETNKNITNITIQNNNINFDNTSKILIKNIKKSQNILIISKNNILGFVIVCGFMIGILHISIFQILILSKYYNISLANTNYLKSLYDYYTNKI